MTTSPAANPRAPHLRTWTLVPILALALGMLLMPMPQMERAGRAAADLTHAPCFAVLAAVAYLIIRRTWGGGVLTAVACWMALVGFGLFAEYAQGQVGRNVSRHDALANIVGVTAGILLAAAYRYRRDNPWPRRLLALAGTALLVFGIARPALIMLDVIVAWRNFPQLANFEWPLESWRWQPHNARLTRSREHPTDGSYCARLDLLPANYPGAILTLPAADWTPYESLVLDISRPDSAANGPAPPPHESLTVVIKIQDRQHNDQVEDRFHRTLELFSGTHTVRIPVTEIANAPRDRWMSLSEVRYLEIFGLRVDRPTTIYVDNIRLE